MEMKKIADHLREISAADEAERQELVEQFEHRIRGHKEEKILEKCLEHARKGEYNVMLGRKTLPPAELKEEGLVFKWFWAAIFCCWD